jgi:hypothetical protein
MVDVGSGTGIHMEQKKQDDLALLGVKISSNTKQRLDHEKIHPREPYTEVIDRLLDFVEKHRKRER